MISEQLFNILNAKFGLSEEDFEESRRVKSEKGGSIGEILIGRKVITENELLEALSIQYDMPFWPDLPLDAVDPLGEKPCHGGLSASSWTREEIGLADLVHPEGIGQGFSDMSLADDLLEHLRPVLDGQIHGPII